MSDLSDKRGEANGANTTLDDAISMRYSERMSATIDISSVLQDVLALPLPERSYIAERLLVSLDDEGELSPAWGEELDARVQRRQNGETRPYDREEVRAHIQAILA